MSQYTYSIMDDGETWSSTFYSSVDTAKAAAIDAYRADIDEKESFVVLVGTVLLPVQILERESAQWMAALRCALEDIMLEEIPWADKFGVFFEDEIQEKLKNHILDFLANIEMEPFAVVDVQEFIIDDDRGEGISI